MPGVSRQPGFRTVSRYLIVLTAVVALAVALALHWVLFRRGFYSIGWDEAGRTLDAYNWAFHGFVQIPAWLPFYRVIVGSALRLYPDLVLTPRVVSATFGLAAIPALGWLAHELFFDRGTVLITLLCAALFSQRIALGLAPLSSIMFGTAIILAMAAFARWLRLDDDGALWLSGLFLAVGNTVRYEGWVFSALFFGIILVRSGREALKTRLLSMTGVGLLLFGFPLWRVVSGFSDHSNPVHAVLSDSAGFSTAKLLWSNPLSQFVWTNALSLNIIGLFAVVNRGPKKRFFVIAAFGPLAVIGLALLAAHAAQTGPAWRDTAVWSFLLVPFTAQLLSQLWTRTSAWAAALPLAVLLAWFAYDTVRIKHEAGWAFTKAERDAGAYVRQIFDRDPNARVLIDAEGFYYLNILVASQHPERFVLDRSARRRPDDGRAVPEETHDTLLMYRQGERKKSLDRTLGVRKIREFGDWAIYEWADNGG